MHQNSYLFLQGTTKIECTACNFCAPDDLLSLYCVLISHFFFSMNSYSFCTLCIPCTCCTLKNCFYLNFLSFLSSLSISSLSSLSKSSLSSSSSLSMSSLSYSSYFPSHPYFTLIFQVVTYTV